MATTDKSSIRLLSVTKFFNKTIESLNPSRDTAEIRGF